MPTHSQLAAQLLRDAAAFFRTIAEQNEPLRSQMNDNAAVFDEVAMLVETDPAGVLSGGEGEGNHGHHHHHHEGGCCGGHGHSHDHGEGKSCSSDDKKEGCDGKGGCSH